MIRLRPAAAALLLVGVLYFAPLLLISHGGSLSVDSSGQWEQQQAETLLEHRLRRLQQNDFSGSTIPPKFTQLDRAAETQRIYRAVAEERNATARALSDPTAAWQEWLVQYNVTYNGKSEADFRRQVWLSNLQRAGQLNQMVGREVAFGLNRFSGLTPEEFLQQYTGDAQQDSGINVTPDDPQMLDTPVGPLLSNLAAGTFITPKGGQQNTTAPAEGNGTTNATVPDGAGTGVPPLTPPNGGVLPPNGLTPPIVRPGGEDGATAAPPTGGATPGGINPPIVRPTPGTPDVPGTAVPPSPGAPPGSVTPPIITPPGGGATPAPGTTPTPGTPPPPGATTPPPPPGVVAPGATTTPAPPGVTPPGTSPSPPGAAPPGSVTPPIIRPPTSGVIPTTPLPPGLTPPPGTPPSPAPGAPAPSPFPGPPTPTPSPSPAPGAPGAPAPSPPPGAPPPTLSPSPASGAAPGPVVRPPIGPPPPAGRRRRQLLEMQLQQWVQQQQQQEEGGANPAAAAGGRGLLSSESSWQQQQEQQQQEQEQRQPGHGYYLVLRGMASTVKQAYHAWGVLLLKLGSSWGHDSTGYETGDSSDAAVGSTPYWLQDTAADEEGDGALPATSESSPSNAVEAGDAAYHVAGWSSSSSSSSTGADNGEVGYSRRQLQQAFQVTNMGCSKQAPWLFGRDRPMVSVDWLRQGVVQPGFREQSNCSNSFAYVTAGLAESTMAMLGYTGAAKRISEAQLMACMQGGNCSRAGTVHVLLNQLACTVFAAAATGPNAFPISESWKAAEHPKACTAGDFNPVETGITGWSFVPPSELAFAQALSRTPIKVAVDATMLQSYRAGFIGCNVKSSIANHAMLAVGYSQRVRATESPGATRSGQRNFVFYTGGSYWMLRNSWGNQGSVDGYVYVAKGCGSGNVAPLGLLANRGVMPVFNASETYGVGRLQCSFPGDDPEPGCDSNLLLKLSSFCAKVDEFLPLKVKTNCSCSCVPV